MSALCICNGESIGSNQDNICEELLKSGDYDELLIKVKTKVEGTNRVHFAVYDEPKDYPEVFEVEIENLKEYFEEKNDERLYSYFVSMVNLLSLMCLDRNYLGIRCLETTYPIDFVLDSFLNEKIPYKLRGYLGKTLLSLHIDKDPLEEINLPTLTRVWQDIAQAKTGLPQPKGHIPL